MMEQRCVYILKGKRYYVGATGCLERRLEEHKRGHTATTKRIGTRTLEKTFECANKTEALLLEKKIKQSGHIERWIVAQ